MAGHGDLIVHEEATMNRRTLLTAALIATAALSLSACAGGTDSPAPAAYEVVTEASLVPGDRVPAPTGDTVLTVSGRIDAPGGNGVVAFDLESLESLGLVEFEVDDDQAEGRRVTFRGVRLAEVLAVTGAAADATMLHTVALNDYAVEIPIEDAVVYDALLATSVDGERMPVDRFGPVRVVYPYDAHDLDATIYDPRWIWQLASIEVE